MFSRNLQLQHLKQIFSAEEVARLQAARLAVDPQQRILAYCVYENPFARQGGVLQVAERLPAALKAYNAEVLILSPFHNALDTAPPPGQLEKLTQIQVPFINRLIPVKLWQFTRHSIPWILFQAEGFFNSGAHLPPGESSNPYEYSYYSYLINDSLFACAVIPYALAALGKTHNLIVHVQDWELAGTALTVKLALLKEKLSSAAVILTSHNPYDNYLPPDRMALLTDRRIPGDTIYQRMIPLTDAPLTPVSENFARELTSDPLQVEHFANHLQYIFHAQGLVGIDNGLFGAAKPPFSKSATERALLSKQNDPALILKAKAKKRKAMLQILAEYRDCRIIGGLDMGGLSRSLLDPEIPIFHMFGRLDPSQKGYDVFARAIERFPQGKARFILTPIVDRRDTIYLEDLKTLTVLRPGEVVIYPFRMEQGYLEIMAGASFSVMPSLYEPFGAATEPYLQGTPVLARATGGLVEQVADIDNDPKRGTGLLFRESVDSIHQSGEWRRILTCQQPRDRLYSPLYQNLVAALTKALIRAMNIYRCNPKAYARMLANGYRRALSFSWEKSAQKYAEIYDLAAQ